MAAKGAMEMMLSRLTTMTVLAGLCCGLQVDPPILEPGRTVIYHHLGTMYGNNLVKCPFTLDEGEVEDEVIWELETLSSYYDPPHAGRFTYYEDGRNRLEEGMLIGNVIPDRHDSKLEFKNITYELWAKYSCTVKLEDGTQKTAMQNIIVLDTSAMGVDVNPGWCRGGRYELTVGPMFPPPVVEAEVVSEKFSSFHYMVQPNSTDVNQHDNGSVSIDHRAFDVTVDVNTPEDAQLVITVFVVRHNGERFYPNSFSFPIQEKLGCQELEVGAKRTVTYNSTEKNCYGQLISREGGAIKAEVRCKQSLAIVETHLCQQTGQDRGYKWVDVTDSKKEGELKCSYSFATTIQLPMAMMVLVAAGLTYNQLF